MYRRLIVMVALVGAIGFAFAADISALTALAPQDATAGKMTVQETAMQKAVEKQNLQQVRQDKELRAQQDEALRNQNPPAREPVDGDVDAYVTIGTGTLTGQYPLYRFYNYCSTELIYLASEISTSGNINNVAFYAGTWYNTPINYVTVYMKHTTDATLATGTWSLTGYTQVYSGSWPNTGTGWMDVALDNAFAYNGTDNLQILVLKGFEQYTSSSYYRYTSTSTSYRMRAAYSDGSQPTYLNANYNRPNIRLDIASGLSNDVGITAVWADHYTTAEGDAQVINCTIKNFGTTTQTSIPLFYNAGGSDVNQTWSGSLPSGSTVDFAFTTTWTPTSVGSQDITCATLLTGDELTDNDTLVETIPVWPAGTRVGQLFNGMTFPPPGWTSAILVSTYNWERFTVGIYPTINPLEGAAMTGFRSFSTTNGEARLVSHPWTVGSSAELIRCRFYMYGDPGYAGSDDRVVVEYSTDSTNWTRVDSFSRYNATAGWYQRELAINTFSPGARVFVGFHAISEYGNNMFVDSLRIYAAAANDVALKSIDVPGPALNPAATVYPEVTIMNGGTSSQSGIPVHIVITEGVTPVYNQTVTYPGPLGSGEEASVAMTVPWTVGPLGSLYDLTATVDLSGDEVPANDTMTLAAVADAPRRYFEEEWSFLTSPNYALGVTGVQDTLIWVTSYYPTNQYLVYDARTLALVDQFPQVGGHATYGHCDMTYDPGQDLVYAQALWGTSFTVINPNTHAVVGTVPIAGMSPDYVSGIGSDGDSCYGVGPAAVWKWAEDGSNAHVLIPDPAGGLGTSYEASTGHIWEAQAPGSGLAGLAQYSTLAPVVLLDTVLPQFGGSASLGGCEYWKSDTFMLVVDQAIDKVWCFRVIPEPTGGDVGVTGIVAPVGRYDTSATVTPTATWRNFYTETADFSAWMALSDPTDAVVYTQQIDVTGLAAGAETTLVFPDFNVGTVEGGWSVACSTFAAGDTYAANDLLTGVFSVATRPPWADRWSEATPMPLLPSSKAVKRGGWLAMGPEGLIYATKGYKTGDFYRYDAYADTWTILADVQAGAEGKMPEKGCRGASDGVNSLYMTKGNNTFGFWGYDIAANTWAPLADVPAGPTGKKVKGGTDLVYIPTGDSAGYVYMLKGYKTEFWRYDPATGVWEARANAPIGVKEKWDKGSWLAFDGENTIYAHKAKYYTGANHEMWKYDIPGDSWSGPLKGMPLSGLHSGRIKSKKAKDGSAGAYFDGMIYALKGGNTQQFYMYDVAADTWTESDTVPTYGSTGKKKRVKTGADLVHWGSGAFFALKGNKTLEMWRYVIPAAMAQPERSGVMAGTLKAGRVGIQLGPNPLVGGLATLRYSLPKAGPATVNVFDVTGRTVVSRSLVATRSGAVSLDLRSLSAGIYLVKVEADGFAGTQKLVIQH